MCFINGLWTKDRFYRNLEPKQTPEWFLAVCLVRVRELVGQWNFLHLNEVLNFWQDIIYERGMTKLLRNDVTHAAHSSSKYNSFGGGRECNSHLGTLLSNLTFPRPFRIPRRLKLLRKLNAWEYRFYIVNRQIIWEGFVNSHQIVARQQLL